MTSPITVFPDAKTTGQLVQILASLDRIAYTLEALAKKEIPDFKTFPEVQAQARHRHQR
jgi:hypothetical protein